MKSMSRVDRLFLLAFFLVPSLSWASWESAEVNLRQAFENHAMAPAPAAPSALGNPEIPTGPTTPPSQPSVAGPSAPVAASAGPAAPVKTDWLKKARPKDEHFAKLLGLSITAVIWTASAAAGWAIAAATTAGVGVAAGITLMVALVLTAVLIIKSFERRFE